jgi:hypothetical protein
VSTPSTAELTALQPKVDRLNEMLRAAAALIEEINADGGELMMSLWHPAQPGSMVRGRLQSNTLKVALRVS